MEKNNELKKFGTENRTCYNFDDFYYDNILLDEKSYENILIYGVS